MWNNWPLQYPTTQDDKKAKKYIKKDQRTSLIKYENVNIIVNNIVNLPIKLTRVFMNDPGNLSMYILVRTIGYGRQTQTGRIENE